MYIQLTEKCNMTCVHCCFAATRHGETMSRDVYIRALELAEELGDFVTLGGGEPTVHPDFIAFAEKAMDFARDRRIEGVPLVITNGKLVTKARQLLRWVENEYPIAVELSQDPWHDPIRPEIVAGFRALDRQRKYREFDQGYGGVRSVSWINPVGRAVEHKNEFDQLHAEDTCCCETVLVDPLGNVFSCGCKTHLLGNVFEHDLADYLRGLEWDELHTGGGLEAREHARLYPQTQQAA